MQINSSNRAVINVVRRIQSAETDNTLQIAK